MTHAASNAANETASGAPVNVGKSGPLAGVTLIEMGQLIAGPFCGQLMADYGADVIKVEDPARGDPIREWGLDKFAPGDPDARPLWWPILARNKRCITANLRDPRGQQLIRDLVGGADAMLENFRPGTLERWGMSPDELWQINPKLVIIRVSGYGQDGPYSERPGYASVGEAMGGLRYLMGDPDSPPSRAGISLGDSLAAMFACLGGLAAIISARSTGRGQVVDASIYESVLGVMESLIPDFVIAGHTRERSGSKLTGIAPSNVYPTADGRMVLIAANQDTLFSRLCQAMARPELASDPRYATHAARGVNQDELDDLIARWSATLPADRLLELLRVHDVVCGDIYRAVDMLADPHFAARRSVISAHTEQGDFPMQGVFPRFGGTPAAVRWTGPAHGQHTDEVMQERLGLTPQQIQDLRAGGVI
jgi:formyl-CoA transferase